QQNLGYSEYQIDSDICYFKPDSKKSEKTFAEEIQNSLNQAQKFISPKFFYDTTGSTLFEKICSLPEYYLTRTEIKILRELEHYLPEFIDGHRLVELGSGSSTKTRLLLNVLAKVQDEIEYMPIDISDILKESSLNLQKDYSNLQITGIIDTYEAGLEFVKEYDNKPNLIAFLGSSYGNFCPDEGFEFLSKINKTMKESDLFLIGLDLVKEKQILEKAYDDSQGITAQFNLNVLKRINQELDGNFDLTKFAHVAHYNEDENRIEMYLRSLQKQSVHIPKANISLTIEKDELIHTENSHKYHLTKILDLFENTGLKIKKTWQDQNSHYTMVLASKEQN
ncbi:MAG: L-histidine N(alpha)-methyltransferase, partial [Nitrosopumilaceae archaeon]